MVDIIIPNRYNNATQTNELVQQLSDAYNTDIINNKQYTRQQFVTDYIDINTCDSDGLDNWGRILGVGRSLDIIDYGYIFGYLDVPYDLNPPDPEDFTQNWDNGTFFNLQAALNNRHDLVDSTYRIVLKWFYFIHNVTPTIGNINLIFQLYAEERFVAYVTETDPLNILVTFEPGYTQTEELLFNALPLIPKPIGLSINLTFN